MVLGIDAIAASLRTLSGEETLGDPKAVTVETHPTMAGRYRVLEVLGRGGMGIVYLACDPHLQRDLALKVCLDAEPTTAARVRREAKAMATLDHPNVVDVYDIGDHEGLVYIAMEYVPGGNAKRRFGRGQLRPWREVLRFYLGAAEGLGAAHRAGIVHRDFKPENVLIARDGTAKVADFGLATGEGTTRSIETPASVSTSQERITRAGAVVGTPAFMAPEQLLGLDVDARADQYAFCATVFEGLFGRRPYPFASVQDRLAGLAGTKIVWPRDRRGVPTRVQAALDRGLSTDPDARFDSMEALIDALSQPRRRTWPMLVVGTGLVGALGLAASWDEAPATCDLDPPLVWGAADSSSMQDGLEAVDPTLAARVTRDLDLFAASWNTERDAFCSGTSSPPGSAATRTCLARTRDAFVSRVELLRSHDPEVLSRARTLSAKLPPADTCRTASSDGALLGPEQREVLTLLERAKANSDAGRILEADGLTADALALARALGQPSLLATCLVQRAETTELRGNTDRALELFEEAYFVAKGSGNESVATDAALLVAPLHAKLGHDERALRWLEVAETEARRVAARGGPERGSAQVRGRVFLHLERYEEASLALEAALEEIGPEGRPASRYSIVSTQAAIATMRGVPAEERAPYTEERLKLALELFGPTHPDTAVAYEDLASLLNDQGRYDESLAALERARKIQVQAVGPNNLALVELDNKLSIVHSAMGDLEAAESALRRALDLHLRRAAEQPGGLVNIESNLGALIERQGRAEEALEMQERALTHAEEAFGNRGLKTAMVRVNLASALINLGRDERAIELLEAALPVFEEQLDPRHPATFVTALTMVHAYVAAKRLDEAERALEKARTYATDEPLRKARLASMQALILLERGDVDLAIASSRDCMELLRDTPADPDRMQCLERAARALLDDGKRREAWTLLEPELDTVRSPALSPVVAASLLYAMAASTPTAARARDLAKESYTRVGSSTGTVADRVRRQLTERFGLQE